jgi:hypothetical protein
MTKPRRPKLHLLPQLPRRDSAEYVETVAYERVVDVGGQEYTVRAELSRAVVADPAEPDAVIRWCRAFGARRRFRAASCTRARDLR